MNEPNETETVFSTPWFDLVARRLPMQQGAEPYYALDLPDYIAVVAVTEEDELLLVRQYRPAAGQFTLELPSGHLEDGETPEAAARRELREETGYEAKALSPLATMIPDSGRMSNRLRCFFAACGGRPEDGPPPEPGLEVVRCRAGGIRELILNGQFDHALHVAVVYAAVLKGFLKS